jgi:hypothetical protein
LPLPEPPDVTASHGTLLVAAHGHPAIEATATDESAAAAPSVIEVGVRSTVQATPAWVMVTGSPEIVSVPVRVALPVLAATL